MVCTTCRCTVAQNNTGICLACQGGFSGVKEHDAYKPKTLIDKLKDREKELEDAIEKGKKSKSCISKCEGTDEHRETAKTSSSDRPKRGRKKQKKEEV